MALKIVSGLDVTSISLSSFLDLAKNELRNAQIHNLSTTQINAISSPVQGQLVYDTTLDLLKVYDGAAWQLVGAEPDDSTIELSSNTLSIKDGGVGTAKIANDAVTAAKLADTAVTAGSYTAADITVDAQGRITAASSGTISTSEIADDAVTAAKLADTAVTAGSYTAADITIDAQGRITAAASGTIATAEIADDAVTAAKIADNSVDIARLNVSDGTNGQVLTTNGSGTLSFADQVDTDVTKENLATKLALIDTDTTIGSGSSVDFTFSGDLSVTGDLVVNGTTTTINSTTTTLDDPIITLGGDTAPSSDDNKDRGVEFRYYDTAARIGFFGYDDSLRKFVAYVNASNASEVFDGDFAPAQFAEIEGTTINATSGFQINGSSIDATAAELNILDGVTASTAEINKLDGVTATTAELNILDGVTATATEINTLDGVASTLTASELNILDGVTATTAEINKLDGVTATTAELNILDGVTATASELNILDGVTATTTELNYVDGVTSAIQTQLDAKPKAYSADVTTSSGTASIAHSAHGLAFPANVQVYDENGQLVLADVRQTVSGGEMTITLNAPDATYSVIAIGAPAA